jgi:hypothetical protein
MFDWNNNIGVESDLMRIIGLRPSHGSYQLDISMLSNKASLVLLMINVMAVDWGLKIYCKDCVTVIYDQVVTIEVSNTYLQEFDNLQASIEKLRYITRINLL